MTEIIPEEIKPKVITPFRVICERVLDEWLFKQYPSTFRVHSPIPLALGTSKELMGQLPEGISRNDFKSAMSWYCGRRDYLKAFLTNTQRINLQGELVGEVTEFDKTSAQERLDNKGKKAEPKKIKPVIEIPVESKIEPEEIKMIEVTETAQPAEEIKTTKLVLKRKTVESAEVTTTKTPTPTKVTDGNIATAKGLKVTMVIDPASIPNVDSTGMKKVTLTINVANSDIQVTTDINAKSYRKALSSIEEYGVEGCNVIIQGSMKQYGVIDDAGLVVQPKKTASSE
jgi:sRNA-binding protein